MNFYDWLLLTAACLFGAMSPGPSLLCVMQHAINDGRSAGIATAAAHAFGVLLWAIFTVFAMHSVTEFLPNLANAISLIGAAFLIYLGIKSCKVKTTKQEEPNVSEFKFSAVRDGFSIAFLNPKLAIFFMAIFSQFLIFQPSGIEKIVMSGIAAVVDGLWYAGVAFIVTTTGFRSKRFMKLERVNIVAGVLFIFLGLHVVFYTITS